MPAVPPVVTPAPRKGCSTLSFRAFWIRQTAEDGGSAVEYGLLVTGIAGLIAAMVFLFGDAVGELFDDTCAEISAGGSGHVSVTC